ncbi:hypothetical protein FRB97_000089 [Tulasnella sp. 331]|nr:hypothetical protein FRB97_000089 [Tulasnella sp. 331]KAG8890808.1 hypothetical protein FRB98_004853 [Tulasnella sp. 332]
MLLSFSPPLPLPLPLPPPPPPRHSAFSSTSVAHPLVHSSLCTFPTHPPSDAKSRFIPLPTNPNRRPLSRHILTTAQPSSMLSYPSHLLLIVCLLISAASTHPVASGRDDHVKPGKLLSRSGGNWYHEDDHPSHALFKRQTPANGTMPAVGSDAWTAMYPGYNVPDPTKMPASWIQALANVEAAGLIPDIAPTTGEGIYAEGVNASDPEICSAAWQCRAPGDIWDAPDGMLGVAFDDGPTSASLPLYAFLKAQGQIATHFYIGVNVLGLPDTFMAAFNNSDDIACHTCDNRVRAIAQHIFGLTQVNWNQDTNDWMLGTNQITPAQVNKSLTTFIDGPKSPGLMILEHELYPSSVQAFINAYPLMKSEGWDTRSIPQLFGLPYYQNAQDDSATVYALNIVANATNTVSGLPISTSQATTATTAGGAATATTTTSTKSAALGQHRLGLGVYLLILIPLAHYMFAI